MRQIIQHFLHFNKYPRNKVDLYFSDKDECRDASTNKCEHHCVNMRGGYKCGCKIGYVLNQDKETCSGTYGRCCSDV